jgi:type II restriction enzyme
LSDQPLNLGFEEAATAFNSASQNARVWTEQWVQSWLFCPNCGAQKISAFANNKAVADFFCAICAEEYELKSSKSRFGRKVVDGAFGVMCARLAASNNPSLILMNYDVVRFGVTNLFFVPKHFFVREIIEERPPLAATARRAGWVGSLLRGEPGGSAATSCWGKSPTAGKSSTSATACRSRAAR